MVGACGAMIFRSLYCACVHGLRRALVVAEISTLFFDVTIRKVHRWVSFTRGQHGCARILSVLSALEQREADDSLWKRMSTAK